MSSTSPSLRWLNRVRPLLAAGAAALVLMLGVLAVSPELHGWLHADHAGTDPEDGCAVVLFSNGVALAVGHIAVTPPREAWQSDVRRDATDIFLVPARYLRQPERGPPLG